MTKATNTLDSVEFLRAKWAQNLTNQYLYKDLASKERAFFTPEVNTPEIEHGRTMKVLTSEVGVSFFIFVTLLVSHMLIFKIYIHEIR